MKKLLIVEDDAFVRSIYCEKFSLAGFEVHAAVNGNEALEVLGTFEPSLVLLDLMPGDMTGVDVLRSLREDPATTAVPVVVLSSAYMGDLVRAAWEAGANQCLSKAKCSLNQLVAEVQAILSGKQSSKPETETIPEPVHEFDPQLGVEARRIVDERLADLADLGNKLAESDPHRKLCRFPAC